MIYLAIDTTTEISSIALADGHDILAEYDFAHKMDLSRRLMPNIESLLMDFGLKTKDIGGLGVSVGPGSFTGLRIGVTTAKTLAQALDVPIVGIVSLDLLARQFEYLPNALVCSLIKVHRGEVYFAFYRVNRSEVDRITEYTAGHIDEVIKKARELAPDDIMFCGDTLNIHADTLVKELGERSIITPVSHPKASILAQIAAKKIEAGEGEDPIALKPFYIRRPTPEIRAETLHSQ